MEKIFEKLGRALGATYNKGKWIYQSAFGSEEDALQAELKVSRDLIRKLKKEIKILFDTEQQKKLERVGAQLYYKFPDSQRSFRFYLISSNDVNAFALPGGIIFVTSALFRKIETDDAEIAFVVAHEMSHIELRHLMNRIIANYSIQTISRILKPGGTLGALAGEILSNLLRSGYSQDNEFEADKFAVKTMIRAGFNPAAAIKALEKLRAEGISDTGFHNYFSTHPPIQERIKALSPLTKKNPD